MRKKVHAVSYVDHKNPNRQYFTQGLGKTAVKVTEDENTLMGDYNLKGGDQLYFKDLGYQGKSSALTVLRGCRATALLGHPGPARGRAPVPAP